MLVDGVSAALRPISGLCEGITCNHKIVCFSYTLVTGSFTFRGGLITLTPSGTLNFTAFFW